MDERYFFYVYLPVSSKKKSSINLNLSCLPLKLKTTGIGYISYRKSLQIFN